MKRHFTRPLPPIEELRATFRYDPSAFTGLVYARNMPPRGKAGEPAGHLSQRYLVVSYRGRSLLAHRVIWAIVHGEDPGEMVMDHIDGDQLNNRIENLRLCTQSENLANAYQKSCSASRYKGVLRNKREGRWGVAIRFDGLTARFGTFPTEREAAEVYNRAALRIYGEFARINDLDNPGQTYCPAEKRDAS